MRECEGKRFEIEVPKRKCLQFESAERDGFAWSEGALYGRRRIHRNWSRLVVGYRVILFVRNIGLLDDFASVCCLRFADTSEKCLGVRVCVVHHQSLVYVHLYALLGYIAYSLALRDAL